MKREFKSKYTASEVEELLDKVKELHSSAINHIETLPAFPYSINSLTTPGIYTIDNIVSSELPEYFKGKNISPIEVYVTSTFIRDEYENYMTQYIHHRENVWYRNREGIECAWEEWKDLTLLPANFIRLFDIAGIMPMIDGNKVGIMMGDKNQSVQMAFDNLIHLLTDTINADCKKVYIKGRVYTLTQVIEMIMGSEIPSYYFPTKGDRLCFLTPKGLEKVQTLHSRQPIFNILWVDPSDVTEDDLPPCCHPPISDKPTKPVIPPSCGPMVPPPCKYYDGFCHMHKHTATEHPFCESEKSMRDQYCGCYGCVQQPHPEKPQNSHHPSKPICKPSQKPLNCPNNGRYYK